MIFHTGDGLGTIFVHFSRTMKAVFFLTPGSVAAKTGERTKAIGGGGGSQTAVIFRGEILPWRFLSF